MDVSAKVPEDNNDNKPDCDLTNELSRSINGLEVNRFLCCCFLTADPKEVSFLIGVFRIIGGFCFLFLALLCECELAAKLSEACMDGLIKLSLSLSSFIVASLGKPLAMTSCPAQQVISEATVAGVISFCCCFFL